MEEAKAFKEYPPWTIDPEVQEILFMYDVQQMMQGLDEEEKQKLEYFEDRLLFLADSLRKTDRMLKAVIADFEDIFSMNNFNSTFADFLLFRNLTIDLERNVDSDAHYPWLNKLRSLEVPEEYLDFSELAVTSADTEYITRYYFSSLKSGFRALEKRVGGGDPDLNNQCLQEWNSVKDIASQISTFTELFDHLERIEELKYVIKTNTMHLHYKINTTTDPMRNVWAILTLLQVVAFFFYVTAYTKFTKKPLTQSKEKIL
eukprot:CAMPEP_0174271552 /NCGR_PEP_ID=MMETSP0439-20130205/48281_1 /TAXON_ID=0 /ORGANISM="Stereomyxa ramosa, Strain Chinc5" /LENGTH=258 /DNA_ID=CAMNT_0015361627 /DNA_START=361 /DNA_END=1137 /DNA_ORIENTATION=+